MNCRKCDSPLSPQKRHCPACSSVQSSWFNRVLPWILGICAVGALTAGIYGGIRENELGQALSVMIPMSALAVGTAVVLFRGATAGWHLWTVLLGIGAFGCMAALIGSNTGLSAGLFFLSTIIYTGMMWRTASLEKWKIASFAYVIVTVIATVLPFIRAERLGSAIGITVFVFAIAGLIVWTYAVNVRWWYHVHLGWSGAYISQNQTGTDT